MKKAEWKVGEKVQVPFCVIFPTYSGWNKYKFAEGTIIHRAVGAKNGKKYAICEIKNPYNGDIEIHQYTMDRVFKA